MLTLQTSLPSCPKLNQIPKQSWCPKKFLKPISDYFIFHMIYINKSICICVPWIHLVLIVFWMPEVCLWLSLFIFQFNLAVQLAIFCQTSRRIRIEKNCELGLTTVPKESRRRDTQFERKNTLPFFLPYVRRKRRIKKPRKMHVHTRRQESFPLVGKEWIWFTHMG